MAKTYKNLFRQVCSFDNLLLAAKKAEKGKRFKPYVAQFNMQLESNLLQLEQELEGATYRPSGYHAFYIQEPKKRLISAAPYRDRIVHHALCNVIAPIFERSLITDTYANRKGMGTHLALERYQHHASKFHYVLKCDIRKYFPSIDHEILKREIRWKIACPETLTLIDRIIDGSNLQEPHLAYFPGDDLFTAIARRKGLPIGNLTSQLWANVYLARFDLWVKHELKAPGYIRYVDDFVLFHHSEEKLRVYKSAIIQKLQELRLMIHPNKSAVYPTAEGIPFLGFRCYPHHRVLKKQNFKNYRRRLRRNINQYKFGKFPLTSLECSINSWLLGHAVHGHNWFCRQRIINDIYNTGVPLVKSPRGSWRLLEQQ